MDDKEIVKLREYNELLYWLFIRDDLPKKMKDYFREKKYSRIAIYGMGRIGELLVKYLADIGIVVEYAIDQNADNVAYDIDVYYLDDNPPEVDVIIITPFLQYNFVFQILKKKRKEDIISIDTLVYMD